MFPAKPGVTPQLQNQLLGLSPAVHSFHPCWRSMASAHQFISQCSPVWALTVNFRQQNDFREGDLYFECPLEFSSPPSLYPTSFQLSKGQILRLFSSHAEQDVFLLTGPRTQEDHCQCKTRSVTGAGGSGRSQSKSSKCYSLRLWWQWCEHQRVLKAVGSMEKWLEIRIPQEE